MNKQEYRNFIKDVVKEYTKKGYTGSEIYINMMNDSDISNHDLLDIIKKYERNEIDTKIISCKSCKKIIEIYKDSEIKKCSDCTSEELYK